jgi:hypothetical protein
MNPLEFGKQELHDLSVNPSAANLERFFLKRTSVWDYAMFDLGPCTLGICDGLVSALKPFQAFELLPAAAQILIRETDHNKIEQALDMVSDLVTAAGTTKILCTLKNYSTKLKVRHLKPRQVNEFGLTYKVITEKHNKCVIRTFFTSLRFGVASPLYPKTTLHKKCLIHRRYSTLRIEQ